MARTVPGSGAVINPIFDETFGVRAVEVLKGGSGYSVSDPPKLSVTGCGTPDVEALLYPIIDSDSGKIIHVRVLNRGSGYDPLRLQIIPQGETPNVVTSFDFNRIWQTHPNSTTTGAFSGTTDRLLIASDNHPKPTWTQAEAAPGGGPLVDRTFNQTFVFRGGKDVPNNGTRENQQDKVVGILANGGLLHTPEWGPDGNAPPGHSIDAVKNNYVKSNDAYDVVTENNIKYYHSNKLINEWELKNGVFDWGLLRPFTWNIKVEYDNIMLQVTDVDETLGTITVGRLVDEIAGNARGEIAKVVRNNQNVVTRIYLRDLSTSASFSQGDGCLGSNGFNFKIQEVPLAFPTGVFYIDFGTEASEFGSFTPGTYYMAPENIKVQRNYLIIWNQSDSSNSQGAQGHPMRFSTTPDGPLNQTPGTLYYKSTGVTEAPAADYENEYQPLFIMNQDESARIYYHCAYHTHMSGYTGDEGYMIFDSTVDNDPRPNTYYTDNFYQSDSNNPATIDRSRHTDGHSKILGMSFDGYPIYGPYGYLLGGTSIITTTPSLSYYGGLFYQVGDGYPTVAQTGSGSGAVVNITEIGTYQTGGIQSFTIAEGGSGYAVGDKIRILHKYDGAFVSGYTHSSWNANGDRTAGVYGEVGTASEFTVQSSWTSANGIGGKPKVTVAADGSVTGFTMGGNGPEAIPGPDGNMGYNYVEDEVITIPGNYIGGSSPAGDIEVRVAWATDDDSGVATITAIGAGIGKETSGYRLKTSLELAGNRPAVTTASTVTYTVTSSNGKYLFDGASPSFLNLERGKTYVFNLNSATNDSQQLLIGINEDGWHSQNPVVIGDTTQLFGGPGITYTIDGATVSYTGYLTGFNGATTRSITFQVPATAPAALYLFAYTTADYGLRTVQDGYILGDLIDDNIFDESVLWDSGTAYVIGETVKNSSDVIYEATAAINSGGSQPVHTTGTTSNWKFLGKKGSLDAYNGKFAVTPEYPNGTYAYYMIEDSSGNPVYPYAIGPRYYGSPLFEGDTPPPAPTIFPTVAEGDVVLSTDNPGQVSYIKMTKKGDNYFGAATARILGGEGSGATGTPTVQTVTGLSLTNQGRNYATPPTLIFEGGGGQGAQGAAEVDILGKVTSISIVNQGEYYDEPPYVLITGGGGLGAKAEATVSQGKVTGINVIEPGDGYTGSPNVIFTKLVNLKRKTRARQAFNSSNIFLTGLVKTVAPADTTIYVNSTAAYPGSGTIILNRETITYTSKGAGRFTGVTRGVNFNYDQRIILDAGQNDSEGNSTYQFQVGDRVIRKVENAANKVAKVYDWDPSTRELLVVFEIDELAFIDGGLPSTEDAIVQFDAGVAASAPSGFQPHVVLQTANEVGQVIPLLTAPTLTTLQDAAFEDDDENLGTGDGIPDLVNTSTDFENQISLDGGIYSSLYGIEATQGGQNTTLFQVGDNIKDGSIPFKYATVGTAGALADGVDHTALVKLYLDANNANGQSFSVNEVVTGNISGVIGTVVTWDPVEVSLTVKDIVPYNTGDVNVGIGGYLYKFSEKGTIVDYYVQTAGTNYTQTPTLAVENIGDIQATGTVNMTTAGDQVASITITNGGYGITQSVDGSYNLHPTVTFNNGAGDTTGSGAKAYAIMGGENIVGNGGATYRIKSIEYTTQVRS